MRMFITSKNQYLSNDMKIFGTCSIPLSCVSYSWCCDKGQSIWPIMPHLSQSI